MKLYYSGIRSTFEPISNYIDFQNIEIELNNKHDKLRLRTPLESHLYIFYFEYNFTIDKLFQEDFSILSVDTETKEYEWLTINDEIVKKAILKCKKRALLL